MHPHESFPQGLVRTKGGILQMVLPGAEKLGVPKTNELNESLRNGLDPLLWALTRENSLWSPWSCNHHLFWQISSRNTHWAFLPGPDYCAERVNPQERGGVPISSPWQMKQLRCKEGCGWGHKARKWWREDVNGAWWDFGLQCLYPILHQLL